MNARCSETGSFPVMSVISHAMKLTIVPAPMITTVATMSAGITRIHRNSTARRFRGCSWATATRTGYVGSSSRVNGGYTSVSRNMYAETRLYQRMYPDR